MTCAYSLCPSEEGDGKWSNVEATSCNVLSSGTRYHGHVFASNAISAKPRVGNGAALQGVVRAASQSLSFIRCQEPVCRAAQVPGALAQRQPGLRSRVVGSAPGAAAPLMGCLAGALELQICPWFVCSLSIMPPTLSSRNAKQMPAGVAEALQSVLQLEGGLSPSEAEEYLTALERSQRFQSETWS